MVVVMYPVLHTLCTDVTNPLMGLFDLSVAPPLLSYAYIPLMVILLVFGVTVAIRAHFTFKTRALLFFSIALSLWLVNEIVQWVAIYHDVIFTAWRLALPLQALVIAGWTAVATRFYPESRTIRGFAIFNMILVLVAAALYTSPANMASYNMANCEGVAGWVWILFYLYQVFLVWTVIGLAKRVIRGVPVGVLLTTKRRMLTALSIIGVSFVAANILGELTGIYEVNLVIPIGVIIGIGFLLITAAEYPVFVFKPQISETLVFLSLALVGSLLLVPSFSAQRVVIVCTVLGLLVLGRIVVRINRRAEKQRKQLEEVSARLQEIDKSKDEFLSFATHQMRSPLVSIKWGTETLLDENTSGKLTDTQKTLVSKVHEVAVAMAATVNDLLDISKIEQGGLVLKPEASHLSPLVESIVEQFQGSAEQKGLTLAYQNTVPPDCFAMIDETKLRQVVVNLIDNAIKYTDKGSVGVSVTKEDHVLRVAVTDTGRGIGEEDKEKLFGKFARGKFGSANKGGSGLGLFLAKKIVEMHGGELSVTSAGEGKGSVFAFTVPCK